MCLLVECGKWENALRHATSRIFSCDNCYSWGNTPVDSKHCDNCEARILESGFSLALVP